MRDYQEHYRKNHALYKERLNYLKQEYIYYPKYIFDYINLGMIWTMMVPVVIGLLIVFYGGYNVADSLDVEILNFVMVLVKCQMFFSILEVIVMVVRYLVVRYLKKTDVMLQYYTENMIMILEVYDRRRKALRTR